MRIKEEAKKVLDFSIAFFFGVGWGGMGVGYVLSLHKLLEKCHDFLW